MGAKAMLAAMVFGTVGVIAAFSRSDSADAPIERKPIAETPWLSKEAATHILGGDANLGPLFDEVMLGAPVTPEARAKIAAFARDNNVEIALETVEGDLAAIRFSVSFGGCCGYEGADVLALRLGRPDTSECCGCQETWIDDWSVAFENNVFMRAKVRVNRLDVRWERSLTLPEMLARTDELLGAELADVRKTAGDRLSEVGDHRYRLQLPFAFRRYIERADTMGLELVVERGKIVTITAPLDLQSTDDTTQKTFARWKRNRARRIVTIDDDWPVSFTVRKP